MALHTSLAVSAHKLIYANPYVIYATRHLLSHVIITNTSKLVQIRRLTHVTCQKRFNHLYKQSTSEAVTPLTIVQRNCDYCTIGVTFAQNMGAPFPLCYNGQLSESGVFPSNSYMSIEINKCLFKLTYYLLNKINYSVHCCISCDEDIFVQFVFACILVCGS